MALTRIRVLNQQSTYNVNRLNANTLVVGGNNITGASGAGGGIVISSVVYLAANGTPLIANAAPTSGNSVIKIIGSGFAANANVFLNGSLQPSANVTFVDSTELRLNMPALASNTYSLMTFNAAGSGAVYYSGVRFDPYPIWTTGEYVAAGIISTQLLVTGYGSGSISFGVASGNTIPSGLTLSANGLITGTVAEGTYNFYVNATDSENEITTQQISLTVAFPDTYFPYTTLLLSASSQTANNVSTETFIDSSDNNYSITGTGTPNQGTFSPFPSTGTWSCYFDYASNSGLTTTYNGTVGSEDFTAEGFFFIVQRTDNTSIMLNDGILGVIMLQSGGKLSSYFTDTGFIVWQNSALVLNTWHHIVVQRASGTLSCYLNGTRLGTQSGSTYGWSYSGISGGVIGKGGPNQGGGYWSNCRISTIARYSGTTITVPTTPFTSDANTTFLLAASNRFIDTSSNSRNVTVNGTVKITRFNPFGGDLRPYSPSTNSGSIYFNGSTDYLTTPSSSAFALGSSNFTIEFWMNISSFPDNSARIYANATGSNWAANKWTLHCDHPSNDSKLSFWDYNYSSSSMLLAGTTTLSFNTWYHVAIVRNSNSFAMYLNGALEATNTYSGSMDSGGATISQIGGNVSAELYHGYISNFRVINNTAQYTSAFTTPTTPLTAITNTSLLLLGDNSKYYDSTKINNIRNVGGVATRTDIKNYGTNSWYFNGSSSYLTVPNTNYDFNFRTGNFTVELWIYPLAVGTSATKVITSTYYSSTQGWTIGLNFTNNSLYAAAAGDNQVITDSSGQIVINQWYHVAFVRNGTTLTLYKNGTSVGTLTDTIVDIATTSTILSIGASTGGSLFFNGYIQDLRVTKSIARYTTTFTPPTGPVPAS